MPGWRGPSSSLTLCQPFYCFAPGCSRVCRFQIWIPKQAAVHAVMCMYWRSHVVGFQMHSSVLHDVKMPTVSSTVCASEGQKLDMFWSQHRLMKIQLLQSKQPNDEVVWQTIWWSVLMKPFNEAILSLLTFITHAWTVMYEVSMNAPACWFAWLC